MNDGVMFINRGSDKPEWGHAIIGPDETELLDIDLYAQQRESWMPQPGKTWCLYLGGYNDRTQVAIALRKPRTHPADDRPWAKAFAKGSWSKMWPLYLAYCNMLGSET